MQRLPLPGRLFHNTATFTTMMNTKDVATPLASLFAELVDGISGGGAYVLNSGDAGLLASLERMSAGEASECHAGGATVAAHVDHVRYGLSLMNRWALGENPFKSADWAASWRIGKVSDEQWREIRDALKREVDPWRATLKTPREVGDRELTGMISSIVHLAYHFGAVRQISAAARGPKESGIP
jgi:hypothetical protein